MSDVGAQNRRFRARRPGRWAWDEQVERAAPALRAAFAERSISPPLMSSAARRVYEMVRETDADARAIARIVRSDAALTAQVLRLANSAAFGGRARVDGVQLAVARVGFEGLRRGVLAACTQSLLVLPGERRLTRALKARSLAAAEAAMLLAEQAGLDPDAAFSAGLLHDIGRVVVHELLELDDLGLPPLLRRAPPARRALADLLHAELGGGLADRWGLHPDTAAAVRFHHEPAAAPGGAPRAAAVLTAAAVLLCDEAGVHPEPRRELDPRELLAELGVRTALPRLAVALRGRVQAA